MKDPLIGIVILVFAIFNNKDGKVKTSVLVMSHSDKTKEIAGVSGKSNRVGNGFIIQISGSAFEEKIYKTVLALRRVKQLNHFIDSTSKHKESVALMITERPHNNIGYYYLEVGRDTPERFVTAYGFYIYKNGFKIEVQDPFTGKMIPVKQWDKMNN